MTNTRKTEPKLRGPVLTLANKITILRMMMIPVIIILLIEGQSRWAAALFALFMVADILDGLLARVRKENTAVGAFLEPMTDKLLLTFVYLTMAYLGKVDMWIFVVVFSRDLLIVMGWTMIYILTGSNKITPRILGRITTSVQMAAALGFILLVPDPVSQALVWLLVAFTLLSVADYLVIGERRLGQWTR